MKRVGNELLLGQYHGYLEVVDIKTSKITSNHQFTDGNGIRDILAIDDTHYLFAASKGLFKTTKDQLIRHDYQGQWVLSLCHVTDSIYLVGVREYGLILWDEEKVQQLFRISYDLAVSIKRVMTINSFIFKTGEGGVKLLSIDDLKSLQFSLKVLLESKDFSWSFIDSLHL